MKNQKLRERRLELKYTAKEISEMVGVSEATISRWETGEIGNMRRDKIAAYAKALQVDPAYIIGQENVPEPEPVDEELVDMLETLRSRPELKVMFSLMKGATAEDVEKATKIIELAIGKND